MSVRSRTLTVELRADLDEAEYEAMKTASQRIAKLFLVQASMVSERKCQIFVFGEDFAAGSVEIPLLADEEE